MGRSEKQTGNLAFCTSRSAWKTCFGGTSGDVAAFLNVATEVSTDDVTTCSCASTTSAFERGLRTDGSYCFATGICHVERGEGSEAASCFIMSDLTAYTGLHGEESLLALSLWA